MITKSAFKSAWWLPHAHLQTLWPRNLSRGLGLQRRRERVKTADGDFLDLDWYGPNNGPLVILLHGLSGSSASAYILGLQNAIHKLGWRSVALNFRGCSGTPNKKARSYHSGETEDIHFLCQFLRKREPRTALMAVGFSLGGNVLLKWLGEGREIDLVGAVAVSVPFRLDNSADRMGHGFSRIYQQRLINELLRSVENKKNYLEEIGRYKEAECLKELGRLQNIRNFRQFDERITAPLHGFTSAQDFYDLSSCLSFNDAYTSRTVSNAALLRR
jgi:predicted alpha/beta-fold hydrolase